jgi:hypothetical protein
MRGTNPVADLDAAQASLADLCAPFVPAGFTAECDVVSPDAIPVPADGLLVHHNHMTVALQKHYGKPVRVQVLAEHIDESTYSRKIALTLEGTSHVVEWGIARLQLRFLSDEVREEVLAKRTPLGAILVQHNVHRRIKPRYFVRFSPHNPVLAMFDHRTPDEPVYGRLGTIYCNDEAAIELLEIVVNTHLSSSPGTPGEAG